MRISKKILACVLAALMAVAMMPLTALAETTYVAEIGSKKYTTVAKAFAAAPTDGTETTITLIADSTSTANIGVYGGSWSSRVGGKNIVLDLNGHTYTQDKTNGTGAFVLAGNQDLTEGNDLTITDTSTGTKGKITSNTQYTTLQVGSECTLTLDGGVTIENTGEGTAIQISGTGKVYYNDATATVAEDSYAIYMYEASGNTTPSIEIAGGEINGYCGIYAAYEASVVMTDGTINADYGFILEGDSTVNVSGGTVDADYVGYIYDDTAEINISGGTFTGDASEFVVDGKGQLDDGTIAVLPTATVTDITADTEYDVAYQFEANNDGIAFNDYKADYIVTVDKDIDTSEVQLFGKIGNGAWTQFTEMEAAADTEYYLARDAYKWQPTYEDICTTVGTFSCAVKGIADTETKMNVKLVIYKDGVAPIVINEFDYTIPGTYVDTMSITVEDNIDLKINMATSDDSIETVEYTFSNPENNDAEDTTTITKSVKNDVTDFTVALAPAQVKDEIVAVAKDENGEVVRTVKTSVAKYCQQIIDTVAADSNAFGDKSAELAELAKSTLDYGKAASDYFNYNESAFGDYQYADQDTIATPDLSGVYTEKGYYDNGLFTITDVTYRATSVPELRFYVTDITEEAAADMNNYISCSEFCNAKFTKLASGQIILQVTDINITKFAEQFTVTTQYGTILRFTALQWVKAAMNKDNELGTLAKSIGNYYLKSVAYFG